MGADLSIRSLQEKSRKKYEPLFNQAVEKRNILGRMGKDKEADEVQKDVEKYLDLMYSEGYFRDSYNGTALFQYLYLDNDKCLSWWQDVIPLQDKKGNISGEKLDDFLAIILASELRLPTRKELVSKHCTVTDSGEDSVEEWHKMLTNKHERLINLISQAMEMNEPISASL